MQIADLKLTSPAVEHHKPIPERHTVVGDGIAPALEWSGVPDGTRGLALICHDPDAPLPHGWTHWVVMAIPPDATGITEGGGEFVEGTNDFGDVGYGAPAPPPGHGTHHYYFWLYALDAEIDADASLTRAGLLAAIDDHVIEQARLIGTCKR